MPDADNRGAIEEKYRMMAGRLAYYVELIATMSPAEGMTADELRQWIETDVHPEKGNDFETAFGIAQIVARHCLTPEIVALGHAVHDEDLAPVLAKMMAERKAEGR